VVLLVIAELSQSALVYLHLDHRALFRLQRAPALVVQEVRFLWQLEQEILELAAP
jgi:hypothetical protein